MKLLELLIRVCIDSGSCCQAVVENHKVIKRETEMAFSMDY